MTHIFFDAIAINHILFILYLLEFFLKNIDKDFIDFMIDLSLYVL